jgi:hypothetical protein
MFTSKHVTHSALQPTALNFEKNLRISAQEKLVSALEQNRRERDGTEKTE